MEKIRKQKFYFSGIIAGAFFLLFTTVFGSLSYAAFDKIIDTGDLPHEGRRLIDVHFPNKKISIVKTDWDFFRKSYEVVFSDGEKVELDSKGRWTEIECPKSFVPQALVPDQIKNYIREHYPGTRVVKIQHEDKTFEVKLDNRMELEFNRNYRLIELDTD